ncbi:MAG TPA: hypothetical protein VFG14_20550, partial [Chthoniobacteraceae bacterium]|nr:hypothetical protein [Chthoniobacteraceae bacterium]
MRFAAPVIAAVVAAFILVSCSKPAGPSEAAKTFFEQVKAGRTEDAYKSGAFAFQAQQSQKFFETALRELGLAEIASVDYDSPEMEDDGRTARILANFSSPAGTNVPLVITMTHESGAWKVFSIKSPRDSRTGLIQNHFSVVGRGPDFVEPVNRQEAPDVETVTKMVSETLLRFNDSVKEKDFIPFFEKCSLAWQDQLVTGEFRPGTPMTMRVALSDTQKE